MLPFYSNIYKFLLLGADSDRRIMAERIQRTIDDYSQVTGGQQTLEGIFVRTKTNS